MAALIVVLDANVLYPANVRDLLLHTASLGLYQPKWTDEIQDEWIRNLAANRPELDEARLRRTENLMNSIYPDARVIGYERHIATIVLPDPNDRHVVAAAIQSHASVIVTENQRDFQVEAMAPFNLIAVTADEFFSHTLAGNEPMLVEAFKNQQANLTSPPQTAEQLLETLLRNNLPHTVAIIREGLREE